MIYDKENGYNIAKEGWVVIDGVEHYVKNHYVACNASLNDKAWNVTKKESVCLECAKIANRKGKIIQLTLF